MKLPRNLTGRQLAAALHKLGYVVVGQTGSHIKLRTERDGRKLLTVPDHAPLKTGTLSGILRDVAKHHDLTRQAVMDMLFNPGAKS
jgi:predicted RNA binding protein YcfA (HicA-like mRNA interferase family)